MVFQVMIKKGNEFVQPKVFDESLTNEHMNGNCTRPQAKHWKNEIRKEMKLGSIPKAPVAVMMDKLELMKQKLETKKDKDASHPKKDEMVPVVEGEDPLAVI